MIRTLVVALGVTLPPPLLAQDVAADLAALRIERLRPLDLAPFADALAAFESAPEADQGIPGAGIGALQAAMADGSLTSEALTLWHLARIRRLDEGLRAFVELNPAALDEARAADARRAAGRSLGPLDGIPVGLKDNIETAGPMHTTANAEVLLDNVAEADAALVANLRAAGAVILGKTSLSEFAGVIALGYPAGGNGAVAGQAINPLGPYPTLGSSAGSAIAVAASLAVVAVGTETSGSLIAPSSSQSVVGMKPTAGLVSGEGVIPLLLNNDGAGPIARSVTDLALLLEVIDTTDAPYAAGLSDDALAGVRVGVLASAIAADGRFADALVRVGATLSILGAQAHPATVVDATGTLDAFLMLLSAGIRDDMMPYVAARHPGIATPEDLIAYNAAEPDRRAPFGQGLLEVIGPLSRDLTPEDHREMAAAMTEAATAALEAAFAAGGGAEVLVSMDNRHSTFYATAGYPAVTVPMGRNPDGAPVGATLIGRPGQDGRLLAFAHALEQATRARIAPDLP